MRQPTIQPRWVRSISIAGERASLRDPEERRGSTRLSGVVRAGVDAARLVVLPAQVAGGGLLPDDGLALARAVRVLALDLERMQVDVAVRAVVGAQAAADAPVLDDDLERVRRRRIEPTGQPTMQSGSRQERQEVATRYLSKRSPSRTRRVTPSCASAQARTHSSQRVHFSRSRTSRLCASISPWSRKSSRATRAEASAAAWRRSPAAGARRRPAGVWMSGNSRSIAWKSSAAIRTTSTWSSAVQVAVRTPSPSRPISPK